MQLVQRIENASQGSLVAQLTLQGCDRGARFLHCQADRHAGQTVRPVWSDPSLDSYLVIRWPIKRDYISERSIHHE
jgi:hypothetical protein